MKISGIYKITSPVKKIYIGKSIDIFRRHNQYKKLFCKTQTHLYNSLVKYGFDKHKFEVVCQCDRSELNNLEKYYIALYQCFDNKYGLNLRAGGEGGGICSKETKLKISKGVSKSEKSFKEGHIPWHKGRVGVYSIETLKIMGDSQKGNTKRKGSHHTEESLKLMSESQKEIYKNGRTPWNKGKKIGSGSVTSFKKDHIPWNEGLKMSLKHCEKLRQAQLKSYTLRKLKESILLTNN